MTHDAIIALANEAAQYVVETAEGLEGIESIAPSTGYEFIREWISVEGEDPDEIWESLALVAEEWPLFNAAYRAKVGELVTAKLVSKAD